MCSRGREPCGGRALVARRPFTLAPTKAQSSPLQHPEWYPNLLTGVAGSRGSVPPMPVRLLMIPLLLALLALSACEDKQVAGPQGEKGEQGPPGPAGAAGPVGPAGTAIRFVDGECRQACTVACEANERILSTHAVNPGGTFVFE